MTVQSFGGLGDIFSDLTSLPSDLQPTSDLPSVTDVGPPSVDQTVPDLPTLQVPDITQTSSGNYVATAPVDTGSIASIIGSIFGGAGAFHPGFTTPGSTGSGTTARNTSLPLLILGGLAIYLLMRKK